MGDKLPDEQAHQAQGTGDKDPPRTRRRRADPVRRADKRTAPCSANSQDDGEICLQEAEEKLFPAWNFRPSQKVSGSNEVIFKDTSAQKHR